MTALLHGGNKLLVANLGDSRCMLGRVNTEGTVTAIPLSSDHSCDVPSEAARIRERKVSLRNKEKNPIREITDCIIPDGMFSRLPCLELRGLNAAERLDVYPLDCSGSAASVDMCKPLQMSQYCHGTQLGDDPPIHESHCRC